MVFLVGLHVYTLSKTLIACRDMQLKIFKVKTLLNNAFNYLSSTIEKPEDDESKDRGASPEE